jgi:hypothetical protein
MPRVTVTPVIGAPSRSRLESLKGCHALYERAVTKAFTGADTAGDAIMSALYDIAVMETRPRDILRTSYLIQFKMD